MTVEPDAAIVLLGRFGKAFNSGDVGGIPASVTRTSNGGRRRGGTRPVAGVCSARKLLAGDRIIGRYRLTGEWKTHAPIGFLGMA